MVSYYVHLHVAIERLISPATAMPRGIVVLLFAWQTGQDSIETLGFIECLEMVMDVNRCNWLNFGIV